MTSGTRIEPHDFLGVPPDANPDEINRAYRRRARALHPDMHAGQPPEVQAAAGELMRLLNDAHRALTEPSSRTRFQSSETNGDPDLGHVLRVRPRSHQAGPLSPGTAVSLTLTLTPPGVRPAGSPTISALDHGTETTITRASLTDTGIELEVRLDTSKLAAHREFDIPLFIQWGRNIGTIHVRINTGELEPWNTPQQTAPPAPEPDPQWPFKRMPRWQQMIYSLYAGLVMPIAGIAWGTGRLGNPPSQSWAPITAAALLLALCFYTVAKTKGLSSPERLGPWGTVGVTLLLSIGFGTLWASLVAGTIALIIAILTLLAVFAVVALVLALVGAALDG